jgi:DNA-binding transcriptional LysR family regulator
LCVNNGDAELPALRAGLGVARLPDFIVQPDLDAGRLEVALEDWSGSALVLHLLTPPGRGTSRRLRAFSDFLFERFGGGRAPWLNDRQRSAVASFSKPS